MILDRLARLGQAGSRGGGMTLQFSGEAETDFSLG
jgi:hypothetical protein